MTAILPFIKLSGTPSERGRQYGERFGERIRKTGEFYASSFDMTLERFGELGLAFADPIERFDPSYAQEIRAIAAGAGLEPGIVFGINARTEIREISKYRDECTSIASPADDLIAQTWDWGGPQRERMILLHTTYEDGHTTLSMVEPGMLGKIGLSSAGIGVCLNALTCYRELSGVPIHILLRAALDSRSLEQARRRLLKARGTASNILLCGEDRFMNLEYADDELFIQEGTTPFHHTNHYVGSDITDRNRQEHDCSFARYERLAELMQERHDVDTIKQLLADTDSEFPILRRIKSDDQYGTYGTQCTIIMEPSAGVMHITQGSPVKNGYRVVSLHQNE